MKLLDSDNFFNKKIQFLQFITNFSHFIFNNKMIQNIFKLYQFKRQLYVFSQPPGIQLLWVEIDSSG